MNLNSFALFLYIALLFLDIVEGQTSAPKKKKKPRRKKQNIKNHIQCFECFRDYSHFVPFNGRELCFNPTIDPDRAIDELLVTCPKDSTVCQMDIHKLNGYFVSLERKCAPACHCICKATGYGLEREICSRCTKPVEYMEFDNDTIPEATCTFSAGLSTHVDTAISLIVAATLACFTCNLILC